MASKALQVGDRVTVGQTELMGTVKFAGPTEFAAGDWLGIELDEQAGKNDGSVKGKRYFESKPEHGIFVRPTAATKVADAEPMQPPVVSITAHSEVANDQEDGDDNDDNDEDDDDDDDDDDDGGGGGGGGGGDDHGDVHVHGDV
eukprot:s1488_g2.t1